MKDSQFETTLMAVSSEYTEYIVKLGNSEDKEFNMMRFKPPHKCDLEKLTNPKLERQEIEAEEKIDEGDGSEYRQKEREEARRRRRGYRPRKVNPSDQPWILKEGKKDGRQCVNVISKQTGLKIVSFIGRKEGAFNSSASYYVMALGGDNSFEAYPISNWYDFIPPVKYNFLNDEEAEERFEKRHKTLNYFTIMVNKRIKDQDEHAEEQPTTKSKNESDSDGEFSSVDSDKESPSKKKKKTTSVKKKAPKKKEVKNVDSEAGEETDEGDMESQEMDYFSSESNNSEDERKLKAVQEQPRDDAEVERKEDKGIDEVFKEDSSSEDELTESGKQLKVLMHKHSHGDEPEEDNEMEDSNQSIDKDTTEDNANDSGNKGVKRKGSPLPAQTNTESSKRPKMELPPSPNSISKEEVEKYLSRKPMTSKALMKKFIKLKPSMSRDAITKLLATIVKSIPDIQTEIVNKKKYLSLPKE